jgi:hypothetical protein
MKDRLVGGTVKRERSLPTSLVSLGFPARISHFSLALQYVKNSKSNGPSGSLADAGYSSPTKLSRVRLLLHASNVASKSGYKMVTLMNNLQTKKRATSL